MSERRACRKLRRPWDSLWRNIDADQAEHRRGHAVARNEHGRCAGAGSTPYRDCHVSVERCGVGAPVGSAERTLGPVAAASDGYALAQGVAATRRRSRRRRRRTARAGPGYRHPVEDQLRRHRRQWLHPIRRQHRRRQDQFGRRRLHRPGRQHRDLRLQQDRNAAHRPGTARFAVDPAWRCLRRQQGGRSDHPV